MTRIALLSFSVLLSCSDIQKTAFSKDKEEAAIRAVLKSQEDAWNAGNIDAFMEGYWKSDSLQFIGDPITRGWDSTLARYKRSYPDLQTMGKLRFELFDFQFLAQDVCLVTGKYHLTRELDNPAGMFTLIIRKKENGWVIIYDHTS
jgi:uncharacterized protein (TIGR02246 family)